MPWFTFPCRSGSRPDGQAKHLADASWRRGVRSGARSENDRGSQSDRNANSMEDLGGVYFCRIHRAVIVALPLPCSLKKGNLFDFIEQSMD